MIHPPSSRSDNRLTRRHAKGKTFSSRILSRFGVLVLGLMLLASWGGYQIASRNLSQSLSALPQFKAIAQAEELSSTLENIRQKFIQLRDSTHEYTPETLREGLRFTFKGQEELIQEIGVKLPDNMGFVLFRDKDEFIELSHDIASTGSYAPFQQLLTFNLSLNKISLFPAVHYTPQGFANGATPSGEAVMRMALPVDKETILILGINFKTWSDQLIPSALHKEFGARDNDSEGGANFKNLQLSYYFDNAGWILAERSNQADTEWHPNIARMGFGGDFGRQGYDAAFRPWAQHEKYWRMVTDIHEGRTGVLQESASGYSQEFKHTYGFLCYAPIVFSPNGRLTPTPIGGIAFFESAPNIFASSFKTIGFYAAILFAGFLLFIAMTLRFCRRLSRPFMASSNELKTMLEQRDLHYLQHDKASVEHASLTSSVNTLITLTKGQSEQLDIMTAAIQQTQATLPIDIDRNISSAILAGEFGLVGSSKAIAHVRENIHKAAQAGTDVLVWGETGTGKELVASAIHKASSRKNGPYISINCGALDENLLMDTLFGHVAGAFSDAVEDRKGAFLAASGGTLHLDELGNASPRVQQSLLRALSVRHIRPLGSDKEIPFDTRVIAATNADLLKAANDGKFRQDLYYRLAIINIHIPPLRQRKEDIPELAAFYIIESCKRLKKQTTYLSRGALKALTNHSWPGNVREFSNCLTRAVAYTDGDLILPEHIAFEPRGAMYGSGAQTGLTKPHGTVDSSWPHTTAKTPTASQSHLGKVDDFNGIALGDTDGNSLSSSQNNAQGSHQSSSGASSSRTQSESPTGTCLGASHPADYIWPAPPRDNFSLTKEAQQAEQSRRSRIEQERFQPNSARHPAGTPLTCPWDNPLKGLEQNDPPPTLPLHGSAQRCDDASLAPDNGAFNENHRHEAYSAIEQNGALKADELLHNHDDSHPRKAGENATAPSAPAHGSSSLAADILQQMSVATSANYTWPQSAAYPGSPIHPSSKPYPSNLVDETFKASSGIANPHALGTNESETGFGGTTLTPTILLLYNQLLEKGEINERQMEALILSHSRKSFTRADYEKISGTNVSSRTIQNDLKDLLKLGLLVKTGNGPSTSYHKGDIPKLKTKTHQP